MQKINVGSNDGISGKVYFCVVNFLYNGAEYIFVTEREG